MYMSNNLKALGLHLIIVFIILIPVSLLSSHFLIEYIRNM